MERSEEMLKEVYILFERIELRYSHSARYFVILLVRRAQSVEHSSICSLRGLTPCRLSSAYE